MRCKDCMMNTICTCYDKETKKETGECPPHVMVNPPK